MNARTVWTAVGIIAFGTYAFMIGYVVGFADGAMVELRQSLSVWDSKAAE